ncbi:MAG: hypothetical protein KAS32_14260 [Candidatus Peribacteraceae bacterium]|nr:hypothetical protein [Candidatus Peribacteraceae bacterium]
MQVFRCDGCSKPCYLTVVGGSDYPINCPYKKESINVKWVEQIGETGRNFRQTSD